MSGTSTNLTELMGWGANTRVPCDYRPVDTERAARAAVEPAGTTVRGLGRSYGDPAVNAQRRVVGLASMDRYLGFDAETGVLECEAGVSLSSIIRDFLPRGFFPAITPGTKYVTVGGCIANDVHGKAQHVQGCFSACVESMRVLVASGEVVTASRDHEPELFWGTMGGLGLLGMVLTARIRLRKVETAYFRKRAFLAKDLSHMLALLEEHDEAFPYSVATVNPTATGPKLGAGVLMVGDHADVVDLPPSLQGEPLCVGGDPKLAVPFELPEWVLNRWSVPILNLVIQKKLMAGGDIANYDDFFYPLDFVGDWYRAYGRRGFAQYQFVIPFENGENTMRTLLEAIANSGHMPFLNVLKRFGAASGGVLSFPQPGFTFAIDFPVRSKTPAFLRQLDAMVLDAGGRIYLGKDAYVAPEMFQQMYGPSYDRFMELKRRYDPNGVFTSNLARRVGLV